MQLAIIVEITGIVTAHRLAILIGLAIFVMSVYSHAIPALQMIHVKLVQYCDENMRGTNCGFLYWVGHLKLGLSLNEFYDYGSDTDNLWDERKRNE
eukprot:TRINITY_DN6571_c0_g1_i1.p3 TRINITY_DN6571_c0_g1~~TRINITY_DN6571_c0_g1_i1.p3  ORF type:complete len:96 (-),score=5.53 TRINITY_DN6571_c0_g1_i1:60-347(-)